MPILNEKKENAYFKRKKRKCLSVSLLVRKEKNMEGKTGEKIGKEIRFYKVFLYRRKKKEENKHEISGSMY